MENVIENKTTIGQDTLNAWKLAEKHGDKTKLAIALKVSRHVIQKAFNGDGSNAKVVKGINKFYNL